MKFLLPLFGLTLILSSCYAPINNSKPSYARGSSGGPESGMPSKPGSCFAKCLIQDEYEIYNEELAVFTGDPKNTSASVETIDFVAAPATTKWIKKKADINCKSDNPEDCLVWCLTEVPAKIEQVTIVTDTTMTDEYQIRDFEKKSLVQEGGFTEWREVVCEKDVNKNFIESLQIALSDRGHFNGAINGIMSTDIKEALVKFQKDHGYPVGQLDLESLDGLGVMY